MWKVAMRQIKPGHPTLAASVLFAVSPLLKLEKFPPRHVQATPKQAQNWNDALNRMLNHVCSDLLERLDSFSPEQLTELFMESKGAYGLIFLLFNGEAGVHRASLNVLKVLGSQNDRRDSIRHVIGAFYRLTLSSVNKVLENLTRWHIFGPCPVALKVLTDVLSCLCDSQDGVLRLKELSNDELEVLRGLWQRIWQMLGMIFEQTEQSWLR